MKKYRWIRTLFLVLFAIGVAGASAYHWFWVRPEKACTDVGRWWDPEARVCAQPLVLSDVTGRPLGQERTAEQVAAGRARAQAPAAVSTR